MSSGLNKSSQRQQYSNIGGGRNFPSNAGGHDINKQGLQTPIYSGPQGGGHHSHSQGQQLSQTTMPGQGMPTQMQQSQNSTGPGPPHVMAGIPVGRYSHVNTHPQHSHPRMHQHRGNQLRNVAPSGNGGSSQNSGNIQNILSPGYQYVVPSTSFAHSFQLLHAGGMRQYQPAPNYYYHNQMAGYNQFPPAAYATHYGLNNQPQVQPHQIQSGHRPVPSQLPLTPQHMPQPALSTPSNGSNVNDAPVHDQIIQQQHPPLRVKNKAVIQDPITGRFLTDKDLTTSSSEPRETSNVGTESPFSGASEKSVSEFMYKVSMALLETSEKAESEVDKLKESEDTIAKPQSILPGDTTESGVRSEEPESVHVEEVQPVQNVKETPTEGEMPSPSIPHEKTGNVPQDVSLPPKDIFLPLTEGEKEEANDQVESIETSDKKDENIEVNSTPTEVKYEKEKVEPSSSSNEELTQVNGSNENIDTSKASLSSSTPDSVPVTGTEEISEFQPENEMSQSALDEVVNPLPPPEPVAEVEDQLQAETKAPSLLENITSNVGPIQSVNSSNQKFQYTSNFMKSLQHLEVSLKRPETLPRLDIVQDSPRTQRHSIDGSARHRNPMDSMFFPNFIQPHIPSRNALRGSSQRMNPGGQNLQQRERPRKIISTSLTQEVKLHTVDNAWKPVNTKLGLTGEDEELNKKVRGILNKLTPEKFEKLLNEIRQLVINTETRIRSVLDLIFDKAVDEPNFCLQYAVLCKHLATLKVLKDSADPISEGEKEEVKFKNILITKCQKEFESEMYEGLNIETKLKEINEMEDEEKQKVLFLELDEEKRRARKRSLGNIKLIGELYKLDMLTSAIMISCIDKLINEGDEESLECLCTLLRTIGEKLESDSKKHEKRMKFSKSLLQPYFLALLDLVKEKRTTPRVRFMIQDILDLRENSWEPRKIQDQNKPKTIAQIHQEVKKEEEQRMIALQQHVIGKRESSGAGGGKGKSSQRDERDTWTVQRKSQQGNQSFNINSLKELKTANTDNMQLGPGGAFNWSQGARGGSQTGQKPMNLQGQDVQVTNRFNALSETERKQMGRSNSSQGKNRSGSAQMRPMALHDDYVMKVSRPLSSKAPFNSDVIVQRNESRGSSMEKSNPSSRNSSSRKESPKKHIETYLREDKLPEKSLDILKEYLTENDEQAVMKSLTKYFSQDCLNRFVFSAINHALEISSQEQCKTGKLLSILLKKTIIPISQFYSGLNDILISGDDIEVDVPKVWAYLGIILQPIFMGVDSRDKRNFIILALRPVMDGGKAGKIVASILKSSKSNMSESEVSRIWHSTNLKFSDFLKRDENEKEFLKANELEFLMSPNESSTYSRDKLNLSFDKNIERLPDIIKAGNDDNEIISNIRRIFNDEETSSRLFISAFIKVVIRPCIVRGDSGTYSLNDKKLKNTSGLLIKYCSNEDKHNSENKELESLFALQELMDELEHPSKLIGSIFHHLHEYNVISQEVFIKWENDAGINRQKGKGMCVMNAKQFLTWLKEAEPEDDS